MKNERTACGMCVKVNEGGRRMLSVPYCVKYDGRALKEVCTSFE